MRRKPNARRIAQGAPRADEVRVLGPRRSAARADPAAATASRLLVKSPRVFDLSGYLREWLAAVPKAKGTLKLEVDVDPQSFL